MDITEQEVARYCLEKQYLSQKQLQSIQKKQEKLSKEGDHKHLMELIREFMGWSPEEMQAVYKSAIANLDVTVARPAFKTHRRKREKTKTTQKTGKTATKETGNKKTQLPEDKSGIQQEEYVCAIENMDEVPEKWCEDVRFAGEILARGINTLEEVNQCLQQKHTDNESQPLMQVMIRNRLLSISDFMKIRRDIESWSPEESREFYEGGPKFRFTWKETTPYIEQLSDFQQIGRYKIIREIGRGAMGIVYIAKGEKLGRTVAIKTIRSAGKADPREIQRFQREAKLAASLHHPYIVAVHEVGVQDDLHYFTMDYIDGISLSEYVNKVRVSTRKIVEILRDITNAMAYAHSNNIIHRDLKPPNILIDAEGKPHLTDFGLARNVMDDNHLTLSKAILGTPSYMSPEQAAGKMRKVNKLSDIYSLGAILYELLVGRPPFIGQTLTSTLWAVVNQDPVPPRNLVKGLPRDLEIICLKCLEKNPARRYQGARALVADLERYLKGQPIQARPTGPVYKFARWITRNKALAASLFFTFIIFTGLFYFFFMAPATLTILAKGRVAGTSKIIPAEIFINGARVHKAQGLKTRGGYRKIVITSPGYHDLEFFVKLTPGEDVKLEKELIHKQGKVDITSSMVEMEASFINKETGQTQNVVAPLYNFALDTGEYEVVLKKRNYFPKRRSIKIQEQQNSNIHIDLEPMLLWKKEVSNKPDLQSLHLVDLDRDGEIELLCSLKTGSLVSLNAIKKEKLWQYSQKMERNNFHLRLCDLNRDAHPEILIGHKTHFIVLDGKNREELFTAPNWWGQSFAIGDANQDGYNDIILISRYKGICCYDGRNFEQLWQNPRVYVSYALCLPVMFQPHHIVHAFDYRLYCLNIQTGKMDWFYPLKGIPSAIQIATSPLQPADPKLVFFIPGQGVQQFDLSSQKINWHWQHKTGSTSEIIITDLNQDRRPEILIHLDRLYCLDMESGKLLWEFDTKNGNNQGLPAAVGDLEGDGKLEIVVYSQTGTVWILDASDRTPINEFRLQAVSSPPIIMDFDHDGRREIILTAQKSIYCIQHRPHPNIKIYREDPMIGADTLAVADVNADGHHELFIGNSMGELYCLDGKSGERIWHRNIGEKLTHRIITADIKGDKRPELIVRLTETVLLIDAEGKTLWTANIPKGKGSNWPLTADFDNDNKPEILVTTIAGVVYCLDGDSGKIQWQHKLNKLYSLPCVADLENDGKPEIIVLESGPPYVHCLEGRSGRELWRTAVPYRSDSGDIIKAQDIDNDGIKEIFVAQIAGNISCLEGKQGKIRWHKSLKGDNIHTRPIIGDFDGDHKLEVIVATTGGDVNCLDAHNGNLEWYHPTGNDRSCGVKYDLFAMDIDADGLPDIVTPSAFHSFYIISGQKGQWLGNIDRFSLITTSPQIVDLNKDGRADMVFVDSNAGVTRIYDVAAYFRKFIKPSCDIAGPHPLIKIAHLNQLFQGRAYKRLQQRIETDFQQMKSWHYLLNFYKGACALSRDDAKTALKFFQQSSSTPANIFDNKFLTALAYLQQKTVDQAQPLIQELLALSIFEFESCRERYRHLMNTNTNQLFRKNRTNGD